MTSSQTELRLTWLVALGIAMLSAALLWLTRQDLQRAAMPLAMAASRPSNMASARAAATPTRQAMLEQAPNSAARGLTDLAGATAVAPPVRAQPVRLNPGEFEVCGLGVVKQVPQPTASMPEATALDREAEMKAALERAMLRVIQSLQLQGDPRSQAAVLLLEGQRLGATALPENYLLTPASLNALAGLALRSRDPVVMQWALSSCHAAGKDAHCAGLNARHWVQLEPGNALAWFALLHDEPWAEAEALAGAARASVFDTGQGRLVGTVDRAIPADLPGYLRIDIDLQVLILESMRSPGDGLSMLVKRCQAAQATRDANQLQQCDAIAHTMVTTARDLVTYVFGIRLGEFAGWPVDRLATLRSKKQTLMLSNVLSVIDLNQMHSCDSVRRMHEWAQAVGQQGELGYALSKLKSGS